MEAVKGEERTTDVVLDFHKNLQVLGLQLDI